MARSILKIDVDDEAFKRFQGEFDKYQKARLSLAKTPIVSPKEIKEGEEGIKRITGRIDGIRTVWEKTGQASVVTAAAVAKSWDIIATRSKQAASSAHQMTLNLIRQVSLGAALGSLVGIGGSIWGLDRLAMSAGAGRRSSSGLGVSYGEQQAFNLTFGRLVDTGSFLGGISQARGNISSGANASLLAMGLNPTGMSSGDLAIQTLDRVRQLAKNNPEYLHGPMIDAYNLGDMGIDVESMRRLRTGSDEEYNQFRSEYAKRSGDLNVADPTLAKWQNFAIQLDVASEQIKTGLIQGLSNLMPHLTQLSEQIGVFVRDLLSSKSMKDAVDWVAGGLKEFGDYIQKEDFKKDIRAFVSGVGAMSDAIVRALKLLGVIPTKETEEQRKTREAVEALPNGMGTGFMGWLLRKSQGIFGGAYSPPGAGGNTPNPPGISGSATQSGAALSITDPQMKAIANTLAFMESRGGPNNGYGSMGPTVTYKNGTKDNAHGRYGVMGVNIGPWSQEALGRTISREEFMRDPAAQDAIMEHQMRQYIKKYGTTQDAFSVWHSGVPLAQAAAEKRADQNMATTTYAARANSRLKIELQDNTGGNVIPQINQIAY